MPDVLFWIVLTTATCRGANPWWDSGHGEDSLFVKGFKRLFFAVPAVVAVVN